ncbi:MAG: EAL domain-containing protein [Micrococcales bacterium]|nr:EAL domain-containing protein [Micrococcales bacterium]
MGSATEVLEALNEAASAICIARQRLEDRAGRLVGFEVLFRSGAGATTADEGWSFDDDVATAQVVLAIAGEFGPQDVAGDALMFINTPRSFLVGDFSVAIEPEAVVLEVLATVDVDDEVLAGIDQLRQTGYALAMDRLVPDDPRLPCVDRCGYVKVDVQQVTGDALAALVAQVRAANPTVSLVATKVETPEQMRAARDAGFDLFQGYLVGRPTILAREAVQVHVPIAARLVSELGGPEKAPADLAELVLADPALARAVMVQVNSVSGVSQPVTSVVQALTLLGRDRLRGIVIAEMVRAAGHQDREMAVTALARVRAAANLAPDDPVGAGTEALARMCTSLLGMDAEDVAQWLPRPEPGSAAVAACDAFDAYLEAADRGVTPHLPEGFTPLAVSVAWLDGLRHAHEFLV